MEPRDDLTKLRELILYIGSRCKDRDNYGSIVLNKLLYFSDFYWFAKTGRSLTNEEYMKQREGPLPRRSLKAQKELEKSGHLMIVRGSYFGLSQKKPIPIGDLPPERFLNTFSAEELAFVDRIIETFGYMTGKQLSDITHGVIFEMRKCGETIPYESIFVNGVASVPDASIEWAKRVVEERANELKWNAAE